MVIALFLINAPYLAGAAVLTGMAGFFLVDAARYGLSAWRETERRSRGLAVLAMLGNLAVALVLVVAREWATSWMVAVAAALRIFGTAWNIAVSPVHTAADAEESVVAELGFSDNARVVAMSAEIEASEKARASIDRGWILSFIATLLAIHVGRMGADRTLLGLLAPVVAVGGDMMVACLITLLVINPLYLLWRWPTQMDRASVVGMVCRTGRCGTGAVASAVGHRVVAPTAAIRRAHARGPLLGSIRAESGAANRSAHRGGDRGDGPRLGNELVFRYRELGGRHVELLGRVAHRRVAGRHGARRARGRHGQGTVPAVRDSTAWSRQRRRLFVHRHRRYRRGGRIAARPARPVVDASRTIPTCASSSSRPTSCIRLAR